MYFVDVSTFTNYKEVKEVEELGQKMMKGEISKEEFFKAAADLGYDVEAIKKGLEKKRNK